MENNLSIVKDQFKELPNNIEAEQAVIGSILVSNDIFDEMARGNYFGAYTFDKPIALEKFETGILKGKKLDSMPAVREALGEITGFGKKDASEILANTALATSITTNRMAALTGKAKSFEKIVLADQQATELGLTPFLKTFDDAKDPRVVRDGIAYEKITDKNMGVLQGYYVRPEVKAALEGQQKIISEKESKQKKSLTKFKSKSRLHPPMEVDLHIHQLVKSTKGMQNHDILNLQLDTAKKRLEFALSKRIQRIVFIHGVGSGVLKLELEYLLKRYDQLKFYAADFQKYGHGATEVYIFQQKRI